MTNKSTKRLLAYIPLPVILLLLWIVKNGEVDSITLVLRCVLLAFVYTASLTDLKEKRVPNVLVLLMIAAWLALMIPQLIVRPRAALMLLISGGVGFAVCAVIFLLVYFISRGGLGGGDVKLMAVAGLYLGFNGALPTMLYGSLLAAVTAGILILCKKMGRKESFPLVPFLFAGMLLTVFFQQEVYIA